MKTTDILRDRETSIDHLHAIIDAWEALPGGRNVGVRECEKWLANDMAPAINAIRDFLGRPKPEPHG